MLGFLITPLCSLGDAWPWWVLVPHLHPASPPGAPGVCSTVGLPCIWQGRAGPCPAPEGMFSSQTPCVARGLRLEQPREHLLAHVGVRAAMGRDGSFPSVVLPLLCWGEGNQQHRQGSLWAWGTSNPLQNASMCACLLPTCQSCFINPLAGMNVAVPTSVLSCLPTISMSSHKIKSNYEQIPAPCSPSPF